MWLIAAQGLHSDWLRNVATNPAVRLKHRRRWYQGTASIHDYDATRVSEFNMYAQQGPRTFGIEPKLVRVDLTPDDDAPDRG